MKSRNFSPDDRVPVRFFEEDEDELCYVIMRSSEAHDVWHTLFGLNTNLTGELALKVIEFQQMQLPMALISFVGASVRFNGDRLKSFYTNHFPWAFKAGLQCTDLMSVYYERYFDEDLEEVRRKWGIIPAQQVKRK
ncbi:hypothetical protein LIER_42109 [Lithospermum erythrorhizon]|uniref:Uncharacterized protein n=1 Tax=Lithospermum erythrorhizon TaxID=34254 RepID=A0AAV3RLE2_LITER